MKHDLVELSQDLFFRSVTCGLTKSTSFNYLCKCEYCYLLKRRTVQVHLVTSVKQWHPELKTVRSLFFLFIVSLKEKGDYQNLAHFKLPYFCYKHHDRTKIFTSSHKKLEELQGHKTTKKTPEKQEDSPTTKSRADTQQRALGQDKWNCQLGANLRLWIYGSLPVTGPSGLERGEAGKTMRRLHFCHSCCGMAWINHRAEVRTASP